ncbi:MAG: hypothetical protein K9W46_04005 [Candidatus Heimdallarchaeum endolithica]|uniref:DDE domain-containing protein n=1 Tax=Candidatus Heimdallarchaeum endolithica TaxID=2876572 RepID=A0A9Y1BSJ3_9ARCH|nr:MAG: hypothetical protein K9W46_04005 [Candidatus Heimdallarchaeum endolithica]
MKTQKLSALFKRCRVPKKIIIKAIYEYIGSKNGLRTVAWKNGLTHQTLLYWVKKFRLFRESLHRIVAERGGIPEIIVVDETEIRTSQGSIYLWFALDPYNKTLLGFSITKGRSNLECLLTFRYWFKCWGFKPRIVVTDAGVWYPVLLRLGIKISVIKGGLRSYIERFNATLKSYRWFHSILHCTCPIRAVYGSTHLSGFLTLFMLHYNFVRPHQSLGHPPLSSFLPRRWYKN